MRLWTRIVSDWPDELASIGAIRFVRRSSNFAQAVRFYRDLVRLPLYETFEDSYGSNGAIFGLPDSALTFEIVEADGAVPMDHYEQLCLYFPDEQAKQTATARPTGGWRATGGVSPVLDGDGRCHLSRPGWP